MTLLERPSWHALAACRGDRRWLEDRGKGAVLAPLRQVCQACPVAGACLREALEMPTLIRREGVLRAGITGRAWRHVEAIVDELQPSTETDWTATAAWLLDGELEELEAQSVQRRPARPRVVGPPATAGSLMRLWHYDPALAGQALTRGELLAVRSAVGT